MFYKHYLHLIVEKKGKQLRFTLLTFYGLNPRDFVIVVSHFFVRHMSTHGVVHQPSLCYVCLLYTSDKSRKFKQNQMMFCIHQGIVEFSIPIGVSEDRLRERGSLPDVYKRQGSENP